MCGIVGIASQHSVPDRSILVIARDTMAHRGPDDAGQWWSNGGDVGFGHRRLAIIDLSAAGHQPMLDASGELCIVFNGEIYNYRELRVALEGRGCVFRTESDTEVLLQLYAAKGVAMVKQLRGMFAFGLWDANKSGLLLARDPYGIKPLYYADDGAGTFGDRTSLGRPSRRSCLRCRVGRSRRRKAAAPRTTGWRSAGAKRAKHALGSRRRRAGSRR